MQILLGHVFPDGVGGGEAAIGEDAVDAIGEIQPRRHQHGRRAHRDPAEVERGHEVVAARQIVHPTLAVEAFEQTEAHIVAAAPLLPSLFNEEHVTAVFEPEVVDRGEIAVPRGAPAVEGDDRPFGALDLEVMPDQPRAVEALDRDLLVRDGEQFFGVLFLLCKDLFQFVGAGERLAALLKLRRVLPVDGEREHQPGDGVGDRGHRGDRPGAGGDRDQDRVAFLLVHSDPPFRFGRSPPPTSFRGCRGRWRASV